MTFDFHTHTFLSDGVNSPIELIRCAFGAGYRAIGITDHASPANLDFLIDRVKKDCELAMKYWDITAIPGIELTNVPKYSIDDLAREARELGAKLIVVHGESIVEDVEPGTNWEALNSKHIDILAHPGIITNEEAKKAAENDIYIEITARSGHSLSNGRVARIGTEEGVNFLINTDSHSHNDLFRNDFQKAVGISAGLSEKQVDDIINLNSKKFIRKVGY